MLSRILRMKYWVNSLKKSRRLKKRWKKWTCWMNFTKLMLTIKKIKKNLMNLSEIKNLRRLSKNQSFYQTSNKLISLQIFSFKTIKSWKIPCSLRFTKKLSKIQFTTIRARNRNTDLDSFRPNTKRQICLSLSTKK